MIQHRLEVMRVSLQPRSGTGRDLTTQRLWGFWFCKRTDSEDAQLCDGGEFLRDGSQWSLCVSVRVRASRDRGAASYLAVVPATGCEDSAMSVWSRGELTSFYVRSSAHKISV